MNSFNKARSRYSFAIVTLAGSALLFQISLMAQGTRRTGSTATLGSDRRFPKDDTRIGSIEEDMRARRAIRFAEEAHQHHVERAEEVSRLASELEASFKQSGSLSSEDTKTLSRLEKLTKKIREEAGGSEDEEVEPRPPDLSSAIAKVAEVSKALNERVQNTPRQVVSTAVIDDANVLLELLRVVRDLSPKD